MQKKDMLERGTYMMFKKYHNHPQAKKFPAKMKNNKRNLTDFATYLSSAIKKEPMIEGFVEDKYKEWKDIMWLYKFFLNAKWNSFAKCKHLSDFDYASKYDIKYTTTRTHNSLDEKTELLIA